MRVRARPGLPRSSRLTLSGNDVHVWCAALERTASGVEKMAQTLSEKEVMRADRFYFERDRKHFIVGRGVLRAILGIYLGMEPDQLEFSYGAYGKPYLADGCGEREVRFNLSHSNELALYAFVRGREIGVDLEYIRDIPDIEQIAARFFSARENIVLHGLPAAQKQEAFFRCWTRKEAYIKAIGNGLTHPLDQFDVSLAPGEPARLLTVAGEPDKTKRWALRELAPAPGYQAALAVSGHDLRIQHWQWPDSYE